MSTDIALRFDAVRSRYRGQFAGQPRITRSVETLEQLITEATALGAEASGNAELSKTISDTIEAWKNEATAIQEAKAAGPGAVALQNAQQWFSDLRERYRRRYAGQSRESRDLGILREVKDDLGWVIKMIDSIPGGTTTDSIELRAAVEQLQNLATTEEPLIRDAWRSGTSEQRTERLARLANMQFARYRLHLAGKARLSRRPAFLRSIVRCLDEVRSDMAELAPGSNDAHKKNLGIVEERLRAFRTELTAIESAIATTSPDQRGLALGDAANTVFKEYRQGYAGKPRSEADPVQLEAHWEELWASARELAEMAEMAATQTVTRNLQIIRDNLRLYGREIDAILKARKSATAT